MKKILLPLVAMVVCAISAYADVNITSTAFPDANFRNKVKVYDTNNDNYLTNAELAAATTMDVKNSNISDLTGIEYFTSLQNLNCSGNKLTSLDLSENKNIRTINCYSNKLTSLKLPVITGAQKFNIVEELECENNQLTELTSIVNLVKSIFLRSLDVSNNKFTELSFDFALDSLRTLNCKDNAMLTYFECYDKESLTTIDASGCTTLGTFSCSDNYALTSLELSGCINLNKLYCSDNALTYIGLSGCANLDELYCSNNQLEALPGDGIKYAIELRAENNKLGNVTIVGSFMQTRLEELYIDNNPQLTQLIIGETPTIKRINATGCTSLGMPSIYNNIALEKLYLNNCTSMTYLGCTNNAVATLRVTNCPALRDVYCYKNQLSSNAMNTFINDLPTIPANEDAGNLWVLAADNEGNVFTAMHQAAVAAKHWNAKWSDGSPIGVEVIDVTYDYTSESNLLAMGFDSSEISTNTYVFNKNKVLSDAFAVMTYQHFVVGHIDNQQLLYLCSVNQSNNYFGENWSGRIEWNTNYGCSISKVVVETITGATLIQITTNSGSTAPYIIGNTVTCEFSSDVNNFTISAETARIKRITVTYRVPMSDDITGDLNGDNVVDVDDMNMVINLILSHVYNISADLNGDNEVDIEDVNMIINIILTSH